MKALPFWPVERIEEILDLLQGGSVERTTFKAVMPSIVSPRDLEAWLYAAASSRGIEAEPINARGHELESVISGAAPAILVTFRSVLAVRRVRGQRVTLLVPEGGERTVDMQQVTLAICDLWQRRYDLPSIDPVLEAAQVPEARRARTKVAFLREQLAARPLEVGWAVRLGPSAPLSRQLAEAGQRSTVVKMGLALLGAELAFVGAWTLFGRAAIRGQLDRGWLIAWALALVTAAACQVLATFWQGALGIRLGALFKKRVFLGALRIDHEEIRREGLGRSMGRVLESDLVEGLSLSGGFLGLVGVVQLLVAIFILSQAHPGLAASFIGAIGALLILGAIYYHRLERWTRSRMEMTHELIECLVGHRTRLAQEPPANRHDTEDRLLADYAQQSRRLDGFLAAVSVGLPRGTLILGLLGILTLMIKGAPTTSIWIALGGTLFAQRALNRISFGLTTLLSARLAWQSAGPLFKAAGHPEEVATEAGLAASLRRIAPGEPLIELRNIDFRFSPGRRPILEGAVVQIKAGERVLIEGSSGSGKSTLAALLAGLRRPQGGLLLLGGLDRATLGATAWRRRVCAAPQQHENHIFRGTLALNLLMGREWPSQAADLEEAEQVCRELGLGDLLNRMPSGIMQTVGDSAWRLSHGEQSRVFMARALLQGSDLVILDETFAALDPETLTAAMTTVRRRARTLAVVAHP